MKEAAKTHLWKENQQGGWLELNKLQSYSKSSKIQQRDMTMAPTTKKCFRLNHIYVLEWPSQSSDTYQIDYFGKA